MHTLDSQEVFLWQFEVSNQLAVLVQSKSLYIKEVDFHVVGPCGRPMW